MRNNILYLFVFSIIFSFTSCAQVKKTIHSNTFEKDSLMLRKIYDEVLLNGTAYDELRVLCKDIGNRLSGSLGAEMAVDWGYNTLLKYDFDTVYLQEIMVPHWERGTPERAYYKTKEGKVFPANILALGGSIGTDGILEAEVVMFKSLEELIEANETQIKGKIVFIAEPMQQTNINAFASYSQSARLRWVAPSEAGKKGAVGLIIRSISLSENDFPNTGVMSSYKDDIPKIPAAALSTNDATHLEQLIDSSKEKVIFTFEMDCRTYPDKISYNVIAEIRGHKTLNNVITVGGHLDSWDVGEGAHDDGAGIVHSLEALRTLKALNYKPNNTIRVVFFMNEENGNRGGKAYALQASKSGENHIYAIESDAGGFTPRGFTCDGSPEQVKLLESFTSLFEPYLIHYLAKGYGGVDINPLKEYFGGIALFGLAPDTQRYFDIHHNANDVFENVNKRELHIGAATIASLIYLLDSRK